MKMLFATLLLLTVSQLTSCQTPQTATTLPTIKKVLILGNSITVHAPKPSIGWNGRWGMAASAIEKDYVHILKNEFETRNKSVSVEYGNIADSFERKFWSFNETDFKTYKDFEADLIILKIGENISDSLAAVKPLEASVEKLITYLTNGKGANICITGSFWPNKNTDNILANLCSKKGWTYVSLTGLYADRKTNTALGQFRDEGIQRHPSDTGMKMIADRIWTKIQSLFSE